MKGNDNVFLQVYRILSPPPRLFTLLGRTLGGHDVTTYTWYREAKEVVNIPIIMLVY
jgi:hypothetical protein